MRAMEAAGRRQRDMTHGVKNRWGDDGVRGESVEGEQAEGGRGRGMNREAKRCELKAK